MAEVHEPPTIVLLLKFYPLLIKFCRSEYGRRSGTLCRAERLSKAPMTS